MNIAGAYFLQASPDLVWQALHDVAVLKECVPGCRSLEQTEPQVFTGAAEVGIAVVKGVYQGTLRLLEEEEPAFVRVKVEARSGHAGIAGEGSLRLEPKDDGTMLRYEGEARVSGPLAAVGQRLLPSASKSLTEQFFRNLEQRLPAARPVP